MIKTLKHLSIIALIVLIITGTYYAKQDRFDVVACVLILINAVAVFWSELPRLIPPPYKPIEGFPVIHGPRPIFDAEHLLEHYDEGYIQAMNDVLQERIQIMPSLTESFVITINALPKVKALGKFTVVKLVDKSHRITFVKRYPDEH